MRGAKRIETTSALTLALRMQTGCKPSSLSSFARYSPTSAYRVVPDTRRVLRRVHNVPAQHLQCSIPPGEYSPLCALDRSATVKTFECLLSRHSTPRYRAVRRLCEYPARHGIPQNSVSRATRCADSDGPSKPMRWTVTWLGAALSPTPKPPPTPPFSRLATGGGGNVLRALREC